jgi:hypothetical protein
MRFKPAISALVVAVLFGATATASAQMQPAPGATSEGNAGPAANKLNTKPGTTTGSATKPHTNKGVALNPSHLDSHDAGDSRGK